jgi:hypothetical protein
MGINGGDDAGGLPLLFLAIGGLGSETTDGDVPVATTVTIWRFVR